MNTVTVNVRKKHFDAAKTALAKGGLHTECCLVAQAVKDVFPRQKVSVSYYFAVVGRNGSIKSFILPKAATRLIHRFDDVVVGLSDGMTKREKTRMAKVRESLPVVFTLVEEEEESRS